MVNKAVDKKNSREGGESGERRERKGRIERSKSSAVSRSVPAKPDRNSGRSKSIFQDFSSREPSVSSYRESTSREPSDRELRTSRESSVRESREPSVISYLDFSRESSVTSRKNSQEQINRRDINGSRDSSINKSRDFNGSRDSSINNTIDFNSSFPDWNTRQIEHGYRDKSSSKHRPVNNRGVVNGHRGGRSRVDSFRDELFEYMDEGRVLDGSREYLQSSGSNFNTLGIISLSSFFKGLF